MRIKVSKFIKKKINKSELKEIFKISNIIEEYLNQKEVNQRIQMLKALTARLFRK